MAPGLRTVLDGTVLYAVPGVPAEMKAIVHDSVLPDLLERAGDRPEVRSMTVRIALRAESEVATVVAGLGPTPPTLRLAYLASPGDLRLRVVGPGSDVAPYVTRLRVALGESVYGDGEETLDAVVHRLLAARGATVAAAESLTGGQLGQVLTGMSGSSATFVGGVVAYATGLKTSLLGVDAGLLRSEGPVHPDVARQMARGVRDRLGGTYGLSTTGVAGPDAANGPRGRTDPGTVYVAVAGPDGDRVWALRLAGTRDVVRTLTVVHALDLLRTILTPGNSSS